MAVVSRGTRAGQVQPAVAGRTRERLPASPAPHKGPPTLPRVRKTRDVWDVGGGEYSRTLSASSTHKGVGFSRKPTLGQRIDHTRSLKIPSELLLLSIRALRGADERAVARNVTVAPQLPYLEARTVEQRHEKKMQRLPWLTN